MLRNPLKSILYQKSINEKKKHSREMLERAGFEKISFHENLKKSL